MYEKRYLIGKVTALPLAFASLALGACSGGQAGSVPSGGQSASDGVTTGTQDKAAATGGASPAQTVPASEANDSQAVALTMPPWSECTIRPEQVDKDPTHTDLMPVGGDGELRFFPPPRDWGSRLELDCSVAGSHTHRVVDLNDESTFTRKPRAELEARRVGVQPALTGDPSTMPERDLLKRGYPPRPDRAAAPAAYAEWVRDVTKPMDLFAGVPVAHIGARAGKLFGTAKNHNWDGFVQSGGFLDAQTSDSSVVYSTYTSIIQIPPLAACGGRTFCETMIWTGLGGYPTSFFGYTPTTDLIQSGIDANGVHGPAGIYLFIEYTPGSPQDMMLPSGYTYNASDQIRLWGWSSGDSSCQNATTDGAFACFSFMDSTRNWAYVPAPIPRASNAFFIPTTVDYVAERTVGQEYSANYIETTITSAGAYDSNENFHGDPATGHDPFVWLTTGSGALNGGLSTAEFANGTNKTPADPMYFIWNKFQ